MEFPGFHISLRLSKTKWHGCLEFSANRSLFTIIGRLAISSKKSEMAFLQPLKLLFIDDVEIEIKREYQMLFELL